MNRESDQERIEDALRARASLAEDASGAADEFVGGGLGGGYQLGGPQDYDDEREDADAPAPETDQDAPGS